MVGVQLFEINVRIFETAVRKSGIYKKYLPSFPEIIVGKFEIYRVFIGGGIGD